MIRRLTLAVLVLVARAASANAPTADVGLIATDLPSFIQTVDRLAAAIEHADHAEIPQLLAAIPVGFRVRAGDQLFDVRFDRVAEKLSEGASDASVWPVRRRAIHAELTAISEEAQALSNTASSDLTAARGRLTGILARPEFQRHHGPDWTRQLLRRMAEWLRDLWTRLGADRISSRRMGLLLAWLATVAAIIGLVAALYRTLAARERAYGLNIGSAAAPRAPARELALRAIEAARAGQTREAVRCAYQAALQRLEDQGAWRIDESRTAREYMRLLRLGDTRRDIFDDVAHLFERVVYGSQTATHQEIIRLTDHLERLGCV